MVEPRRSTRATSAKPAARPIVRASTQQIKRRKASSPERDAPPPPKRAKSEPRKVTATAEKKTRGRSVATENKPTANGTTKTKTRSKLSPVREDGGADPPPQPAPLTPPTQTVPYFNPLPTPVEHLRPGLQLFAWGTGNFGQFGMGPDLLDEFKKPKKSVWAEEKMEDGAFGESGAGLESISAGGLHSLFIDEKGTVWTCGVNDDAALGRVTQNVADPDNPGKFLDIDDLTAYPHPLQTLLDEKFRAVKVTAGDSISAALSCDGELRVWGSFRANEGSLGFANGLKHQFKPVPILTLPHKPGDYEKVVDMASGSNHLLVLTTHGNLYTWGAGEQSQLGRKILERRKIHGTVPEKVILGSRSRKAVKIGSGIYHSFAVDDAGDVWGWGLNTMGQTGTGYNGASDDAVLLPKKVVGLSKEDLGGATVVEMDGGDHHSIFLTSDGRVFACGRSNGGQLGLAEDHPAFKDREHSDFVSEPVQVTFPEEDDPIVHISSGPHYNMAVSRDGALYSWGQGTQSELGAGDEEEVTTPKMIVRREGGLWQAVSVSCGGQHALGLFRKKA